MRERCEPAASPRADEATVPSMTRSQEEAAGGAFVLICGSKDLIKKVRIYTGGRIKQQCGKEVRTGRNPKADSKTVIPWSV
jgi:hypothetical protein